MNKYLKDCVEKHHWRSLEVFLLGGGGYRSYAKGEGGIATGCCDLKEISLCDLIKSKPNMYCELISVMIDHGVLVDGRNEQDIPLASAVNYGDHDLAVILLKKNANPYGLLKSKYGKHDDTSIHTAFRIGLSLGNYVIQSLEYKNSKQPSSFPGLFGCLRGHKPWDKSNRNTINCGATAVD